jgi:purine-binding chemotaxis protein CheW
MQKEKKTAVEESLLVATFALGDGAFGIDTVQVQEVVRVGDITPVHHAPPYLIGIRNLRGHIVTVIDLRVRLELGAIEPGPETRILIVEWQGEQIGLTVDRIADTITVNKSEISTAPPNVHGVQGKNFIGVCRSGERLVALLDLSKVLATDELAVQAVKRESEAA